MHKICSINYEHLADLQKTLPTTDLNKKKLSFDKISLHDFYFFLSFQSVLVEFMESDYRPLRVNGRHGWGRTLCFHCKAHGQFACECPNLSAPSGADMDFNKRHSMRSRNRHGSVNAKQMAGIDLNSMIKRILRDFDLNSMIKRNLRDFVNDMEIFNGTVVVPRDANLYNVGDEQNGIDLNSMIRWNLRDFYLNSMITWNLCDFVNDIESLNGPLVVARDANFDNMGGQQNDLVPDIDYDHAILRDGINPDEFTRTLLNFPDVCQQASFANDGVICDNVRNDMTYTRVMVSPGFGQQNTGCLDDVNCDARHDYSIGINWTPAVNLYQTGSYENDVMNVLSVVILMLIPYQVNRVMPVTSQLSVPAHTTNMLVSLKILTIFVVVKLISILFTWSPHVLMKFICILVMIILVNFSYSKFGVSSSVSIIRK